MTIRKRNDVNMQFIFDKSTGTILGYNEAHPDFIPACTINNTFTKFLETGVDLSNLNVDPIGNYEEIPIQNLIIPKTIDGIDVKAIGPYAFSRRNFKGISLPGTVTHIKDFAFAYSRIEEFPCLNGVEYIGTGAFFYCDFMVDTLIIPKTVECIGSRAFAVTVIDKLIIEAPLEVVRRDTFRLCNIRQLSLPDTLTKIRNNAFSSNNIETVTFPKNLVHLHELSFADNPIDTIVINDNLQQVDFGAFDGEDGLNVVVSKRSFETFVHCFYNIDYYINIIVSNTNIKIPCVRRGQLDTIGEFMRSGLIKFDSGNNLLSEAVLSPASFVEKYNRIIKNL